MLKKAADDLKDYARADYARDILAANAHLSVKERWQLVVNSEEHQRRQLFARTRAKYLIPFALLPVVVGAVLVQLAGDSNREIHLMVGSHDVADLAAVCIGVIYIAGAFAIAWRLGNAAARRQWAARSVKDAAN